MEREYISKTDRWRNPASKAERWRCSRSWRRGTIRWPATAVPPRAKKTRQVFDYAGRSLLLSQVFRGRFLQ
jgi:hypothetical protein